MKKAFQAISVASIFFFIAFIGFTATLAARGALSPQRVDAAVAALRGEVAASQPTASRPHALAASQPAPAEHSAPHDAEAARIQRIAMDRRIREIEDQWDMLHAAQVEFLREKEEFAEQRRKWQEQQNARVETGAMPGANKELEYLSGIKATLAKDLMRQKKDDDVVQLLLQMEARTGRKIIESCKTEEERLWIGRILNLLRQRNDRQAEALTAGKP